MRYLLLLIYALSISLLCKGQRQNIAGIFRQIDMVNRSAIYIEMKDDSTAIIKKVPLKDSFPNEKGFIDYGNWKLVKDTIVLNFERAIGSVNDSNQFKLLIKNKDILYSQRNENGKFFKDAFLWKALKFIRLPQRFMYEYYKIQE